MAEELGLEYVAPSDQTVDSDTTVSDTAAAEEFVAKEPLGINVGLAASIGLLKGESFSGGLPLGGTLVLTTPYGFKLGPFDYTVSLGLGNYIASAEEDGVTNDFNPIFVGLGGNLTLAKFVFAEGHVGLVGEGSGSVGLLELHLKDS